MIAIRKRPMVPTARPEFLMASGMARMPVPMLPFRRWSMVSQFLKKTLLEVLDPDKMVTSKSSKAKPKLLNMLIYITTSLINPLK